MCKVAVKAADPTASDYCGRVSNREGYIIVYGGGGGGIGGKGGD